jgi:hypothetical protein
MTTDTKPRHSPAPWEIDDDNCIRAATGDIIATGENMLPLDEHEANMKLILAAPALLAACKALVDDVNSLVAFPLDKLRAARAAIAHAEQP